MNLHFNHLYLVIPDKTYRAILVSDFLTTAFPGVERRVTKTAAGERWSGTYFYTRENYIELFPASSGFWEDQAAEGWGGLAFSVDEPGGVEKITRQIQTTFGYEPFHTLRELQVGSSKVNWFHYVRTAELTGLDSFDSWVMEYTPEIFRFKGLDIPLSGEMTREAYLSQWNKPRPKKPGVHPPVFSRVTGATLRMDPDKARKFASVMETFGYTQSEKDGALVLQGNGGIFLRFLPEEPRPNHFRIYSVTLAMSRPSAAPTTFVFPPGSRLELRDDNTAEWFFGEG